MDFDYVTNRIPGHVRDMVRGTTFMAFVDDKSGEIRIRVRQPSGPEVEFCLTQKLDVHGIRRFES